MDTVFSLPRGAFFYSTWNFFYPTWDFFFSIPRGIFSLFGIYIPGKILSSRTIRPSAFLTSRAKLLGRYGWNLATTFLS